MSCPRCAKPVPPGAAFCPSCGLPMRPSAPTGPQTGPQPTGAHPAAPHRTGPQPAARPTPNAGMPGGAVGTGGSVAADFAAQQKRNRIAMGGGAALAVIAALFGLRAVLNKMASAPPPALKIQAQSPPPALALPAKAPPPALNKVASRPVMPADVEAWLKHLEKCENEKVRIAGDQMAEAMVLMQKMQVLGAGMGLMDPYDQSSEGEGDKDPGTYAKGKVMDFRPQWEQLLQFFNSVPPPEECKPIAADFNRALGEVPGMMGDIGEILNNVTNDPSSALQQINKFKGGSYGEIDRYFARTDQKVGQICAKYEKNKWFNIKADVAGGSPLSVLGNMGTQTGGGLTGLGQ